MPEQKAGEQVSEEMDLGTDPGHLFDDAVEQPSGETEIEDLLDPATRKKDAISIEDLEDAEPKKVVEAVREETVELPPEESETPVVEATEVAETEEVEEGEEEVDASSTLKALQSTVEMLARELTDYRQRYGPYQRAVEGAEKKEGAETSVDTQIQAPIVQEETPAQPFSTEPIQFIGEEEGGGLYEILNDPKKFNELLNRVYQKGIESTVRVVPEVAGKQVTQNVLRQVAVNQFFRENPDLVPLEGLVALHANEIHAKNGSLSYEELLQEAGKATRVSLGKVRVAEQVSGEVQKARETERKPAFAGGAGTGRARGRQTAEQLAPEEKDMLRIIGA